jgi:hypothetical protein
MAQATSPYVFPFRPFRSLDKTAPLAEFAPARTVDRSFFEPMLEVLAPALTVPAGDTLEDRLLAFFAQPSVVFGDPDWILSLADQWKAGFRHFIERKEPMLFTILGFPFKAPVPLKTPRMLPDFGEVVMLKRLNEIGRAIAAVYPLGVKIHVFAEGAFARLNDIPQADADRYFDALEKMSRDFGFSEHVVLHDLQKAVEELNGFEKVWAEVSDEIRQRRDRGDEKTVVALRDALPVTFHLMRNEGVDDDTLRRAYLNDGSAKTVRADIQRRAEESVVGYRGFLEARDRVSMLERYAPRGVALTVSPRPGRIGVRPLPAPSDVLPYHGVPVWTPKSQALRIEYYWDLVHEAGSFEPIKLQGDADPTPFLYIEQ